MYWYRWTFVKGRAHTHFAEVPVVHGSTSLAMQHLERSEAIVDQIHVWQSRVEIEGYSAAYFDRIVAFEALYR